MIADIIQKLDILNCPVEMRANALKFSASLSLVSKEELTAIINYLIESGLIQKEESKILIDPLWFKILPRGLEYIKTRVAEMQSIDELPIYKESLGYLNIPDLYKRVKLVKDSGDVVKNLQGKYAVVLFNKQSFIKQYGNYDVINETVEDEVVEDIVTTSITDEEEKTNEVSMIDTPTFDEPQVDNNLVQEPEEEVMDLSTPVIENPMVQNPVSEPSEVVVEPVQSTTEETPIIDNGPTDVPAQMDFEQNPINNKQPEFDTERFEKLSVYLKDIYEELFGMDHVPAEMLESTKTFMSIPNMDDNKLIFELLTSGSNYTDDQKKLIQSKIDEELTISLGEGMNRTS